MQKKNTIITNTTAASRVPQANCYNAPTNVKMTLAEARVELESHGFVILGQHESGQLSSSSSSMLVARRSSQIRSYNSVANSVAKLDTLVFVQELSSAKDPLTVGRIQSDLQRLQTEWLKSLPRSFYSPRGWPPQGWSRGRVILMIYLSPHQPIPEHVALHIAQKPPQGEWCQVAFVTAQDVDASNDGGRIITVKKHHTGAETCTPKSAIGRHY
jgi:hypothetical protein